jgi:hypothetical protein
MRFTLKGIEFTRHAGWLLWRWPWSRKNEEKGKYWSYLYSRDFNSLSEHDTFVENIPEHYPVPALPKISGFSLESIISDWVSIAYSSYCIVVLTNIRFDAKGLSYWARIPQERINVIKSDIVMLSCSIDEVSELVDSIDPSFAEAYGFIYGEIKATNCYNNDLTSSSEIEECQEDVEDSE